MFVRFFWEVSVVGKSWYIGFFGTSLLPLSILQQKRKFVTAMVLLHMPLGKLLVTKYLRILFFNFGGGFKLMLFLNVLNLY